MHFCGVFLAVSLVWTSVTEAQIAKDDARCRTAIRKSFVTAVLTGERLSAKCHASRVATKLAASVDCNDLVAADPKGKLLGRQAKIESAVLKACTGAGASGEILERFGTCSSKCEAETGVANPMTTFEEVGRCLSCVAQDIVERRGAAAYGSPDPAAMSRSDRKCLATIMKGYGKDFAGSLKAQVSCQHAWDKEHGFDFEEPEDPQVFYGNWCGAGGSGTPINWVDQCCKNHDDCWDDHGLSIPGGWLSSAGNCNKNFYRCIGSGAPGCAASDPKEKLLKARERLEARVGTACDVSAPSSPDSCDTSSLTALTQCLREENRARTEEAYAAAFGYWLN